MTVGHRSLRGSARRGLAVAAMSALVLASLPLSGTAFGAQENTEYLTGADNVEAALAWSQFTFDSAAAVALGRDDVFADSLASGLIQGLGEGVPLLLTDSDTLDPAVSAEIERLGATTVHILGGETAISSGVEDALEADGLTIHRHAGASRVETAIDIASKHGAAATTAIVARAFAAGADPTQAFADSLAAGAWAAEDDLPILLTQTNELHEAVEAYLASSDIDAVNVVGGTSAVSDAVVSSIEALGIDVTRVSGATRFDTATAIAAARGFDSAADAVDGVVVIEGQAADSWAAGFASAAYGAGAGPGMGTQAIGENGRPTVLVNGNEVPAATQAFLADGGGINVVCFSNATACDAASAAAGNGVLAEGNATFLAVPELVSAEVTRVSDSDDTAIVAYTFDEALDEDTLNEGNFSIVLYDGSSASANNEDPRLSSDGKSVSVEFDADDVVLATAAVVDSDAAEDQDGDENIPGSAPLQDVSLAAGETVFPDLVSVVLDGDDQEATFTFDEDVDTAGFSAGNFHLLVDTDGDDDTDPTLVDGTALNSIDDDEVVIEFGAGLADEDAEDEIVRAIVEAGEVQDSEGDGDTNLVQSVELNEDTQAPTLERVEIDAAEDEAVWVFSEDITLVGADLNDFVLHTALGDEIKSDDVTIDAGDVDDNELTLSYADDTFEDDVIVAATLETDDVAVNAGDPTAGNTLQSLPMDAGSFAAGETTGPDLEASSLAEDLDSFGEVQGLELTLDFDEDVDDDDVTESLFTGYEDDGDSNGSIIASGDCDNSDDDDSVIVCTIDEDEAEDILVILLEQDAVTDGATGNYPVAVGLES